MAKKNEEIKNGEDIELDEGDAIERGFEQMELLYKSRCVQPPAGSNVTVQEIEKDD